MTDNQDLADILPPPTPETVRRILATLAPRDEAQDAA